MKPMRIGFLSGILIMCFLLILCGLPGFAGTEQDYIVSGKDYVLPDDSRYDYSGVTPMVSFFYGTKSLGKLHINGPIEKSTKFNGYAAYGATGSLSIQYTYDGAYQKSEEESWHIVSDGMRWIRDYDLGFTKTVGNGCIMIEKSTDAENWETVINPVKNYFIKEKSPSDSLLYTIPESEYMNGMYYRVVVAYRFAKRTHDGFWSDEYDNRKCAEVYEFYVASEKNYVTIRDMGNSFSLNDQASTDTGFMICKNGSQAVVTVNRSKDNCQDYDYFTEPGKYNIHITTQLGKKYNYTVSVANGSSFTPLQPKTYESEKDKGFPLEKSVARPVFGSSLTSLSIVTPKGFDIKQDNTRYGIKGKSVSLYLKLNHGDGSLGSDWVLSADSWGKNKNQLVCGVQTGEIGKGALIIQTSRDGKNWNNDDKGRYAKGYYTTDYVSSFGKAENVLIYTPWGQDVANGIHIRILFAYQVNQASSKDYRDYVEAYQFYLCSDELGAVTFHNLSLEETLDETFADADQNTVEVYKQAESLESGSYTATGFQIDKNLNPTVKHTVLHNGVRISNTQKRFEETGKYEITLTSAVGSTRDLTIYVDRLAPEEAMKQYFGESFLSGKRIFSEGEYPVYEGGELSYHVSGLDNMVLPLFGQITNISTGSVITIEQNPDEKTGIISEPGEYQAVFATSEKVFTGELAGDARVFTFQFRVIPQGTAPGPVVNQNLLNDYSHSTVTDCNPIYYGLTYSSAEKGKITLAFASMEAAVDYAYEYEKGMVELQDNGGYRYNGSFVVDQNIKYDSTWDLTDAVYYFAEAAVHKHYFDMSDEFTYLALKPEALESNNNLRQLELPRSVTIFADGQKEKLADIDALPLLNDKPYAYLDPETGKEDRGVTSFEFITDKFGGIDSKSVLIIDSDGGQHAIRYSESVGKQLLADNCPSGIVTIHEETLYGDSVEYQAVYIAPGENQTELALTYTHGEENDAVILNSSNDGTEIIADTFKITGLNDPLDPYSLLIVKHGQQEEAYTAKDTIETKWSDPGEYRITCVNRMGYGYTVVLKMNAADMASATALVTTGSSMETVVADRTTDQSQGSLQSKQNEIAERTDITEEQITEATEEKQDEKKTSVAIIGIIAGLIVLAVLCVIIFRRAKLFSSIIHYN